MATEIDRERNRFSGRAARYARVGTNMSGVAARMMASRLIGRDPSHDRNAAELAAALGGLKGPLMKVAQLLSTIPDALPPEYATELAQLQQNAPPMGWAFVRRRMTTELGPSWQKHFRSFEKEPAAAASLGQVHRAVALDGTTVACKLQYPDMDSAVEADLHQLGLIFNIHKRMGAAIDTSEIRKEIGMRLREELDYDREARACRLYANLFREDGAIRVPEVYRDISTRRLLTLSWLDGARMLDYRSHPLEERNLLARTMFRAWWEPFVTVGVIHGDPHLGNYSVWEEDGSPAGINLLDYGCIRIFPPTFVGGVVDLYFGLLERDEERIVAAYEAWGFRGLKREVIEILNLWAKFIYGPILDDRTRTVADGIRPGEYGRREAFTVHQELKKKGPVTIPQEFVFMDRAAIGLGAVFLHLDAEMNFYRLFHEALEGFSVEGVAARQKAALDAVGLPHPD